ncbi:MAG: hypothetical protein C7B45_09975 [Sulfobacillus acidophilus]|uniref:Uncharacterized protein n=1 Tax=Sulfobacillus acidophilus TaxID=53633 RepID=A0A2T2WHD1_9FIRM|nr:MAG: hypothetical protein C7B45_09975 [Sulfobacillus acidophilus]
MSGGHVGLALLLLAGVWLLIAPVWVGFSHHRMASRIDEWAGASVIFVSVVTFFLQWVFGLSDLIKSRVSHQETDS